MWIWTSVRITSQKVHLHCIGTACTVNLHDRKQSYSYTWISEISGVSEQILTTVLVKSIEANLTSYKFLDRNVISKFGHISCIFMSCLYWDEGKFWLRVSRQFSLRLSHIVKCQISESLDKYLRYIFLADDPCRDWLNLPYFDSKGPLSARLSGRHFHSPLRQSS